MLSPQRTDFISIDDYLQGELSREIKHEYLDGQVYAMAGASKNHQRIIANMIATFVQHLKNTPCDTFSSDIKVRVSDLAFFYPDVIVTCQDNSGDSYYTEQPLIIVEVLSKSTRRTDETIKRRLYQTLPSLQEYVLIEQDIVDIEICRRDQSWQPEHYFMGDEISFAAIDLTLSVNEIYERVINDDVSAFFDGQT
ncbi:MAG: Uma2 family endonuclease [Methylococcales bacterium]